MIELRYEVGLSEWERRIPLVAKIEADLRTALNDVYLGQRITISPGLAITDGNGVVIGRVTNVLDNNVVEMVIEPHFSPAMLTFSMGMNILEP